LYILGAASPDYVFKDPGFILSVDRENLFRYSKSLFRFEATQERIMLALSDNKRLLKLRIPPVDSEVTVVRNIVPSDGRCGYHFAAVAYDAYSTKFDFETNNHTLLPNGNYSIYLSYSTYKYNNFLKI